MGKEISAHINANNWAKSEADKPFEKSIGMDSFEMQKLSFEHAKQYKPSDELLRKMHEAAFDSGIEIDKVKRVLGVELRDCLLAKHSKTQDSIDKYVSSVAN